MASHCCAASRLSWVLFIDSYTNNLSPTYVNILGPIQRFINIELAAYSGPSAKYRRECLFSPRIYVMVQNLCCSIYATLNGILLADLLLPAQGAKVVQGGASAAKDTATCITLCFGQAPNGEPTYRVMSDYASDLPNSSNACNCSNIHIIHNTFN
jgi:hypothetical protein